MRHNTQSQTKKGCRLGGTVNMAVILISFLFASLLFTGCEKDYINGDLDGLWEIQEITIDKESVPLEKRLFWSFSFHVVQLSEYGEVVSKGNLRFDGSTLSMNFPFDTTQEGAATISEWGVYENPVVYTVDRLDSSTLIMTAGEVTLHLKKF